MSTGEVIMICVVVAILSLVFGIAIGDGCNIRELFCKHDYEEQYRHLSYARKEDLKKGITNGVDVGYICKKCKKVKECSITFKPIGTRDGDDY